MPRRVGYDVLRRPPCFGIQHPSSVAPYDDLSKKTKFEEFVRKLQLDTQNKSKREVEVIIQQGPTTTQRTLDKKDIDTTIDTLVKTITPILLKNEGDITEMSNNAVIKLEIILKKKLQTDAEMWTQVMTKKISLQYFEKRYWTQIETYNALKINNLYVRDNKTIIVSKQLVHLWNTTLKVTSTSVVSLNNAVLMYVTRMEKLKNYINYLFFLLKFTSPALYDDDCFYYYKK